VQVFEWAGQFLGGTQGAADNLEQTPASKAKAAAILRILIMGIMEVFYRAYHACLPFGYTFFVLIQRECLPVP
jgi:hypothetical protein